MGWVRSFCVGTALVLTTGVANAGVHVALVGATHVAPNEVFELRLVVPQAGTAFNGYGVTIVWDPSKLTFVPASPLTLQEGAYMTSVCGATFHWFQQHTTDVEIAHALWCAGVLVTGPGELYKLRFRAIGSGPTQVTIAENEFLAAGYTVPTESVTSASSKRHHRRGSRSRFTT
jgi:hypothetical protein